MSQSKERELLNIFSLKPEGFTTEVLTQTFEKTTVFQGKTLKEKVRFPKRTLFRNIKRLVKEGLLEKVDEPGPKGRRGRPPTRYRIPARFWNSQGFAEVPVGQFSIPILQYRDQTFFLSEKQRLGTKFKRFRPGEKQRYEQYKAELKEKDLQGYKKLVEFERKVFRKHVRRGTPPF